MKNKIIKKKNIQIITFNSKENIIKEKCNKNSENNNLVEVKAEEIVKETKCNNEMKSNVKDNNNKCLVNKELKYYSDKILVGNLTITNLHGYIFNIISKEHYQPNKRVVVKISASHDKTDKISEYKRTIYRKIYGSNLSNDNMALTYNSYNELYLNNVKKIKIIFPISKCQNLFYKFLLYYHHPHDYVRVPFKISLLSIGLGLLAILISVLSLL